MTLTICYTLSYVFGQTGLSKPEDPDEPPQTRRLIRVYIVCFSISYFNTTVGSKLYSLKYVKELR